LQNRGVEDNLSLEFAEYPEYPEAEISALLETKHYQALRPNLEPDKVLAFELLGAELRSVLKCLLKSKCPKIIYIKGFTFHVQIFIHPEVLTS
jgi:hypothetical protein